MATTRSEQVDLGCYLPTSVDFRSTSVELCDSGIKRHGCVAGSGPICGCRGTFAGGRRISAFLGYFSIMFGLSCKVQPFSCGATTL